MTPSFQTVSASSPREQIFRRWVEQAWQAIQPSIQGPIPLQPISGDAGFRNYYRLPGSRPAMLAVDAPPATEKNQAFCHVARLLRQHGIHAPQVYAVDFEQGFLLIEDLGEQMYWPLLQQAQQANHPVAFPLLYQEASHCLLLLHRIPAAEAGLGAYDAAKLRDEMALFPEWFVSRLLQVPLTTGIQQHLQQVFDSLINLALQQPSVVVLRDFHCRNLLKTAHQSPGVIDFQDAVTGPITYDLVSLYRDCYIVWPASDVRAWVEQYRAQLVQQHSLSSAVTPAEFLRWFDWMGLQRHIKVLGIFARLYLRDNKPGYLNDLPLVIAYTLSVARQYEEFQSFVAWFEEVLIPAARGCDWYREIVIPA